MRISKIALIIVVCCICVARSQIADEDGKVIAAIREALGESTLDRDTRSFANFAKGYNRNYKDDKEMLKRFKNFQKNMRTAERLARENPEAEFGVTPFSDMSEEEFSQTYLTLDPKRAEASLAIAQPVAPASLQSDRGTALAAPQSIDWNALGKVTPVRNQGNCGCCYAFSALADIESQMLIKKGKSVSLSPQQVVDCDKGNLGCDGGFYTSVWTYIKQNGGIMLESKYPYKARKSTCAYKADSTNIQIAKTGAVKPTSNSFAAIQEFISTRGPASAAIDASMLFSYRGGILNKTSGCTSLNHAVLITGYNNAQNYFIVKNSWGAGWGEKGYFRMTPSTCLISKYVQGSNTV